jgi:hypothetical protein
VVATHCVRAAPCNGDEATSGLVPIPDQDYRPCHCASAGGGWRWFVAIRGVALVAAPSLIASAVPGAMGATPLVRIGFGTLLLVGLWPASVGWSGAAMES